MSISGDFNQRINPFINSTNTTSLNINSSGSGFGSVTGSTWGDIGLSIFNTGTNFAMMALMSNAHLSSATSEVRESAQSANALKTLVASYNTALQTQSQCQIKFDTSSKELAGLEKDLTMFNAGKGKEVDGKTVATTKGDDRIAELQKEKADLQAKYLDDSKNADTSKTDTKALAEYNQAVSELETLKSDESRISELNGEISSLQGKLSSIGDVGNAGKPDQNGIYANEHANTDPLDAIDQSDGAEYTVSKGQQDKSQPPSKYHDKQVIGKDDQGNTKCKFVFNRAKFQSDYKKASEQDKNIQEHNKLARSIADKKSEVTQINSKYDNNIQGKKQELTKIVNNTKLSDANGSTTSASSYQEKIDKIDQEIAHISSLDKEKLTKSIADKKAEVTKAKADLEAADKKVAEYKGQIDSFMNDSNNVLGADGKIAREKSEAKAWKNTGANGKKRTWFQKMLGTNKSDRYKQELADVKAAKSNKNANVSAFMSDYGLKADEKYLEYIKANAKGYDV